MSLFLAYAQAWRDIKRWYYEAARNHLTRTNPCHPDIPDIVRTINDLKG